MSKEGEILRKLRPRERGAGVKGDGAAETTQKAAKIRKIQEQLGTESGETSTSQSLPTLTDMKEFEHLNGKIYVNLHTRLSQHSNVFLGKFMHEGEEDKVAVKLLAINTKNDAETILNEAKAIQSIDNQNIIKYLDADFSNGKIRCAYLAMELCSTVSLHDYVIQLRNKRKCFDRHDCMSIAKQLANALDAVHKLDILHRDIKPSNVLFKEGGRVLKLTDFSLEKPKATRSVTVASNKRIGTDGWRAPESLERNEYGAPSDVFSMGLVFYYAWSNGDHAFGSDPDLINYNIKMGRNRNLSKIHFPNSEEAEEVLNRMLEYDYRKRPAASGIVNEPLYRNAESSLENPEGCPEPTPHTASQHKERRLHLTDEMNGQCIVVFDRNSSMMHAYFPSRKVWGHMQRMSEDMLSQDMTVVVLGEYIYTLLQSRKVFRIKYNNPNACWEQQNDMHAEHGAFPSAAVLDGRIYVIGGSQWGAKVIKEGEVYNPVDETWTRIPDMTMNRKVHTVVACKGCVYSIGGWDKAEKLPGELKEAAVAKGERFDPKAGERGEWSEIRPMHRIRYATAGVSLNDKIYILGGWREGNRLAEAETYDPVTDSWTRLANMRIGRSFFSAVAVEDKIYAVNGDDVFPQTIEVYDPAENEWETVEKMENMQIWCKGSVGVMLKM